LRRNNVTSASRPNSASGPRQSAKAHEDGDLYLAVLHLYITAASFLVNGSRK